ncbi:hypothetical protein [Streptomyces sp. NPDC093225]|uniref:hypothetical protein n=1 Tax=Streptomyces sp. NPDC093225 TaxID=3366034 RepID=UPI0037F1D42C
MLLLIGTVGCGTSQEAESGAQKVAVVPMESLPDAPVQGLTKGMTLPLDAYTYTAKDRYIWQVAVQNQWRTCMRRYGLTRFNPPTVSSRTVVANIDAGMGRRYGLSDAKSAKSDGYHLPQIAPEPSNWQPASGAEEAVFSGTGPEVTDGKYKGKNVPKGGCRKEASTMYPLPDTPQATAAQGRAFSASRSDKRVVQAVAAWSACMKARGYKVADPFKAAGLVMSSVSAPAASPEEIRLATADVMCKTQVRLIDIWHAAETVRQKQEIALHSSALTADRVKKDKAAAKAAAGYTKGAPR